MGTTGLTFTTGDGTADASLTFQGTPDSLNTALAGMTYQPPVGFSGEVTLTVETTDGDGASDTDSFKITISAVNDAPVVSLPAAQSVAKESTLTFNAANGNALSITDDAAARIPRLPLKWRDSCHHSSLQRHAQAGADYGVDDHGGRRRESATITFEQRGRSPPLFLAFKLERLGLYAGELELIVSAW